MELVFIYVFYLPVVALMLPLLFNGGNQAIRFLGTCLAQCLLAAFPKIPVSLRNFLKRIGRSLRRITPPFLIFFIYLIEEWRKGPHIEADDQDQNQTETETEEERREKAYTSACASLGLKPDSFTKAELKAAYRRVIGKVHPDKGGTEERAQEINLAYATIKKRAGW